MQEQLDNIRTQSTILAFSIMGSLIIGLSYLSLVNIIDVNKYYVYYGSSGPYEVVGDSGEVVKDGLKIGQKSIEFHAGDWLGFISDITVERDVDVKSYISLVNSNNVTLKVDEFVNLNSPLRKSGQKNVFFHLPDILPPGDYELRRHATFRPKFGIPVSQNFDSVKFKVN